MAILGKIRERSVFLIIIIAMALFAFVLTGLFDANSPLFNKNTNVVGEVNGESISREEFAELVEQQRARTNNRGSQLQSVNAAWDNLVREKVYETQLKKSGIVVGEKDIWDEVLKQPFVQNNPQFKNEAGLFDEEKLKEFIATLEEGAGDDEQSKADWLGWLNYERNLKTNLQLNTYSNLIKAGLSATLVEGERDYNIKNTKLDIEYVHVPFSKISDSLVTVTDDEIKAYVKDHADEFKSEPSRNLTFVKFDIKATPEDEAAIKAEVAKLINDNVTKGNINVSGLSNTNDYARFFTENSSDTPYDEGFYTKSRMVKSLADTIFSFEKNQVYGPYKDGEYFKITKVVDVKKLPDSSKSSHIIIPYVGARNSTSTKTKEQAKKTADSILNLVKNNDLKFKEIADEINTDGSKGKGGDIGWVSYAQAYSPSFDRNFAEYIFQNRKDDVDVVETAYGYHVIKINNQTQLDNALQLATFSRKIEASEETENAIFEEAETFASNLVNGKDINELAKEKNYTALPIFGVKELEERVSTLGNQREIVKWAFEKDTEVNDIKRFDVDNGYAVVKIDKKIKKGLSIGNSKAKIRNKLLNEKKAKIIADRMQGKSLQEIATEFNTNVGTSKAVSVNSPALTSVGRAPNLINTIQLLALDKVYRGIESNNAIFALKLINKEAPAKLNNSNSFTSNLTRVMQNKVNKAYEVLKKSAEIDDNRAVFY